MKGPFDSSRWVRLEETPSTQDVAESALKAGEPVDLVVARNQTQGRGRFDRIWISEPDDSLTVSFVFHDYADHPEPHLLGMAVALAAAAALHARVRWPNDLGLNGRKVGGILTELVKDGQGRRVPVVGMGLNLNQKSFPPEIADRATSFAIAHGATYEPEKVLNRVLERLKEMPEPTTWKAIAGIWELFDDTPGKQYNLNDGTFGTAIAVDSQGRLLCTVDGETRTILAADAIFGNDR